MAPGGVLLQTSNSLVFIILWLRSGDARPGPRLNPLLRLNRRWTDSLRSGLLTFRLSYVPAFLRSGLPTPTSQPTYLASLIVHHQFKRNIYLSLLCDWIFLCLQNHFSFLSSKYAVEACDSNIADLVHFSSHVQASHVVMHLFCVADSVIFS